MLFKELYKKIRLVCLLLIVIKINNLMFWFYIKDLYMEKSIFKM